MIRLVVLFLTILPFVSYSSAQVTGNLDATKACPAYVSKNKKTNPAQLHLKPGQRYDIHEVNRPINPDWLRVEIKDAAIPLRWVRADCGEYRYESSGREYCKKNPGLADSYVLALSWQPAFCQTYGYEAAKPECLSLPANSYQANHLSLHGLWPNQASCGQSYGFCGVEMRSHHCEYLAVELTQEVAKDLQQLMPSYAYGSCLERHEWNKHGSCQILSSDEYFSLAMRLNREVEKTALGQFLHNSRGETVKRAELREKIRQSFGKEASNKVYLGCKNGLLVDVYIQLPALIPANESLESLVKKAPDFQRPDACPAAIGISDFNSESWF